jgi:hypothetical protein
MRQVLRWALARSMAARMALRSRLNAVWESCSVPPGGVLNGTVVMPSTPV